MFTTTFTNIFTNVVVDAEGRVFSLANLALGCPVFICKIPMG
jgi:hypothetical protein